MHVAIEIWFFSAIKIYTSLWFTVKHLVVLIQGRSLSVYFNSLTKS